MLILEGFRSLSVDSRVGTECGDVGGLEDGHEFEETFSSSDYSVTRTAKELVTDFEAGR